MDLLAERGSFGKVYTDKKLYTKIYIQRSSFERTIHQQVQQVQSHNDYILLYKIMITISNFKVQNLHFF